MYSQNHLHHRHSLKEKGCPATATYHRPASEVFLFYYLHRKKTGRRDSEHPSSRSPSPIGRRRRKLPPKDADASFPLADATSRVPFFFFQSPLAAPPVEGRWRLSDFRATKEVKCEGCSADLEMVPMVGDGADLGRFNQNCWKKKRNRRRWKGKRKGIGGNNLGL
ncbi:hypothetical protein LXL04_033697 [Taraxacum kok-saghyz]